MTVARGVTSNKCKAGIDTLDAFYKIAHRREEMLKVSRAKVKVKARCLW